MSCANRKKTAFCFLHFLHTTSGLIGLCMSTYSLAWNIGKPWLWDHILVVSCIATSIIAVSMKDALRHNECFDPDRNDAIRPPLDIERTC